MTELLEHKTITSGGVQPTGEDGVVEALVSVTGIKDNVNDIIMPGAYEKTLQTRTPKGVWSHDWNTPVSKVREIKELQPGDAKLPKTLANGDPWPKDAGALYVKAEFNLNTVAGREAYENVKFFGENCEWSIGYKVSKGGSERGKDGTRFIKSLDLFEYSPVLFGANSESRSLQTSIKSMRAAFESDAEFKKALLDAFEDKHECAEGVKCDCDHDEEEETVEETPENAVEGEKTAEEPTDEELIALLADDAKAAEENTEEKTEERTHSVSVTVDPVILEKLEELQTQIKSLMDAVLKVEDPEEKAAVEEIESKSVENALKAILAGSVDEKVADELSALVEKFATATDEDGIKSHSIAILDLIDASLDGTDADQERELKTLAKAIGEEAAAFEIKEAPVEVPAEVVTLTQEELRKLLEI